MEGPSLYEMLGVTPEASPESIRSAYRELALKMHPDRSALQADEPAPPVEDSRFSLIAEAYRILSDSQSRTRYDEVLAASSPLSAFAMKTAGRLAYRRMGGVLQLVPLGAAAAKAVLANKTRRKGRSLRFQLNLDPDDARHAAEAEISYQRPMACKQCQGTGKSTGGKCKSCGGAGRSVRKQMVAFDLPGGLKNGSRLRMKGKGEEGLAGADNGDLIVEVVLEEERVK